ncbi:MULTISPECIES: hypothetical protein [unclassified Sphingobacterium]|uniref:hypothetical protein n=1 Tax=unclassified Sphingobacterium TaxID=2609468 RepID=UPI00104A7773|nr:MULTISPECIES: hypothetical protein [unclassified Sphingobacterium]MCS3554513.1 hypothetical protein [Sphingobacterium sp. JUb21]TCR07504.1 hypothetical protein EDF66_105135 [Sphingobacterium sp. JUb20]
MKSKKTKMILLGTVAVLIVLLIASNFIYITPNETLLYKAQQYVTYSKADWENYEENKRILANNPTSGNIQTEVAAVVSPDDIYSLDTSRVAPEVVASELEKIKKANFDRLVEAKIRPDHEDAQAALIRHTDGRLTDVIINQKINIKVGKCYDNPNTDGNYNCVSCMILLYNRDKKDWQEAPDGDNFLKPAYDFYQPSKGDIWEAKDLTMRIPFDYDLYKKFEGKE